MSVNSYRAMGLHSIKMYVMLVCQSRNFSTDFTVYNVALTVGRGGGSNGGVWPWLILNLSSDVRWWSVVARFPLLWCEDRSCGRCCYMWVVTLSIWSVRGCGCNDNVPITMFTGYSTTWLLQNHTTSNNIGSYSRNKNTRIPLQPHPRTDHILNVTTHI